MLADKTPAALATLTFPVSDPSPARLAEGLRELLGSSGAGGRGRVVRIETSASTAPAARVALDDALEAQAALHPGVQLVRSMGGDERVFCWPTGLPGWLSGRLRGQSGWLPSVARFTGSALADDGAGELRAEVALQWVTEGEGSIVSLVNGVPTPAHGTPLLGLVAGLSRALEEEGLERDLLHYGMPALTRRRVLAGVAAIVTLDHPSPRYSTPSRQALASVDAQALLEQLVHRKVRALCREQPGLLEALLGRALGQPVGPRSQAA